MASCSSAGERSCRSKAVSRAVEARMLCSDLWGEGESRGGLVGKHHFLSVGVEPPHLS